MTDTDKTADPRNPLSKLDERVAMALSHWAYPHSDIEKANKVVEYPEFWIHARPGDGIIPESWPVALQDANGKLVKGSSEGWNTQHNAKGQLENQFMVSINRSTREITFDFKGSDAKSNWVSNFKNAGASEFAKIQAQAQKALEAIISNPNYADYRIAATGHSLGGGMAQSFALKNNLDVYVYNSLPIARDTINSDYFKDAGGYYAALAWYKNSNHQVHDVRTPNDIATYNYDKVMQNHYLSTHVGDGPTILPGSSMPPQIKTALMLSGYGTLVATAIMGQDHTIGSMLISQHGLSVGVDSRYRIPEGHQEFAQLSPEARKLFAKLSESPVANTSLTHSAGMGTLPVSRFMVTHEDGGKHHITAYRNSGDMDIDYYNKDGQRTLIKMNPLRQLPATAIEFEADNQTPRKTERIAMFTNATVFGQSTLIARDEAVKMTGQHLANADKSPSDIISTRIAENLAKDPEFLNRLALSHKVNAHEELSRA